MSSTTFDPDTRSPVPAASAFRDGMARLAAAVSIVTTSGPAGRAGFTATSVCPVTDAPPTLLVCVNRGASVRAQFSLDGPVCVSLLSAGQEHVARRFASGGTAEERFAGAAWRPTSSGAFALADALCIFDCRLRTITPVGTHDVLFCDVTSIALGPDAPALVYHGRAYGAV